MKSLLELWNTLAQDLGGECSVSTARDYETVARRVETEGVSFLTITLPEFGKDLERSLALGRVAPNAWTGFRKRGGLPLFLGGFLEQVFDTTEENGVLDAANPRAVYAIRQLAGVFAKIQLECSPSRVHAAYDKYIECEKHVQDVGQRLSSADLADFHRVGRLLYARLFNHADSKVATFDLRPGHGPGATANGLGGNAKYANFEWPARLDRAFPFTEYLLPNVRFYSELDRDLMREPRTERPVKVIHVPKTLKTPRIIAEEPSYMMYMQQALWRELKIGIESDPLVGPLIGFSDQLPNRQMAQRGSALGDLATLDLSEASDRVSNLLVKTLCKDHPHLDDGVQACRSTHADVRGHGVIPLSKFASMGSALCFPFEAMVFTTIVLLAVERQDNRQYLTWEDVKSLHGRVRVYGDDIIVPVEYAVAVSDLLERFGLVVNRNKSFWTGKFRESCGGDYYAGVNVTPVRLRRMVGMKLQDAEEVASTVAFRNLCWQRGLVKTVEHLDRHLDRVLNGIYPEVDELSPLLGRWTSGPLSVTHFNKDLHQPEVEGWILKPKKRKNPLDGIGALMKYFLNASDLPVTDKEHLVYSGRPVAVTLKRRRMRVFF